VLDANHKNPTPTEIEQTEHAVRVLRFLGSAASTRELARRFWSHDQQGSRTPGVTYPSLGFYRYDRSRSYWDFKAGLIGSPYRAVAIQELTAAIDDPRHPATRAMAETLALLEIQSNPEYPRFLLRYNESDRDEWERQRQAKAVAYNDLVAKLLKRVQ
jgi:hypothetical protein